jgi:hypothetical protein
MKHSYIILRPAGQLRVLLKVYLTLSTTDGHKVLNAWTQFEYSTYVWYNF